MKVLLRMDMNEPVPGFVRDNNAIEVKQFCTVSNIVREMPYTLSIGSHDQDRPRQTVTKAGRMTFIAIGGDEDSGKVYTEFLKRYHVWNSSFMGRHRAMMEHLSKASFPQ